MMGVWGNAIGPVPTLCTDRALGRRRGDRAPATGALWHIRVVPRGIVAIVPGGRSRLDKDLGGWSDNQWRGVIRRPVRPDGHPEARPEEAMPAMPEAVPAMPGAMATMPTAVPTTPRVPWRCARPEQHQQHPEQHQPLLPRARCLVPVVHGNPLAHTPSGGSVRYPCLASYTPNIPHACVAVETHPPYPETPLRCGSTRSPHLSHAAAYPARCGSVRGRTPRGIFETRVAAGME